MSPPRTNPGSDRRGIAIGAVLLVGLGVLLIVVGTLHFVRAGVSSMGGIDSAIQTRLAARSAVRVLAADLFAERDAMLRGSIPNPPDRYELFELPGGEGGRIAVVRLLPLGPGGARVISEAAKIDLNLATATELAATGLLSPSEAATIVAARDARPGGRFEHLTDLLALEGDGAPGPGRVLGPLDEIAILSRVDGDEEDLGERISLRLDDDLGSADLSRPLSEVLTVHSFEPDLRIDGAKRLLLPGSGEDSIDLDGLDPETRQYVRAWLETPEDEDDEAAQEDEEVRDDDVAGTESMGDQDSGTMIDEREFVRRVWTIADRNGGDAGLALDAFTPVEGGWRNGLLDINLASSEALRGLDGMDETMATAIVARRDSVAEDRRFDRFWPITEGVVEADSWLEIVPRTTTRSLVWRATFAVGVVSVDDPDAPLESPIAWEVVVDCGGDRPRLVEIRDVTMLELVARMLVDTKESVLGPEDPEDLATDGEGDLFAGDPLFPDDPLFSDPALFDDDPLFSDSALFDDQPIFGDPPLFPGSSAFTTPRPGDFGEFEDPGEGPGASRPRDRGPGGRWRPATGSR